MKWPTDGGKSRFMASHIRDIARQGGASLIVKPEGRYVRVSEVQGRICYSKLLPVKRERKPSIVIIDECSYPWETPR